MLLTFAFYFKTIKWILPTAYFVTTLPTYFLYWLFIRLLTLPVRKSIRTDLENNLFEIYSKQFVYYIFKNSASNVIVYDSRTIISIDLMKVNLWFEQVFFYGDVDFYPINGNVISISNHQTKCKFSYVPMNFQLSCVLVNIVKFIQMYQMIYFYSWLQQTDKRTWETSGVYSTLK